jgi:hypothetical protein
MERPDRDSPEHAAAPQQGDEGFAEGIERKPDSPAEEEIGDYGEGVEAEPEPPAEERMGRFSDGIEREPETTEKNLEGTFASGVEADPSDRYEAARESAAERQAADDEIAENLREPRPGTD